MRVGKAYIASLGTTSVLVTSSLLMLTFVSALVAFRAWPGADIGGAVQGLLVEGRAAPAADEAATSPRPPRLDERGARTSSPRSAAGAGTGAGRGGGERSPSFSEPEPRLLRTPSQGGGRRPSADAPAEGGGTSASPPPVSQSEAPSVPAVGGDVDGALDQVAVAAPQLSTPLASDPVQTVPAVTDSLDSSGTSLGG